MVSNLPDEQKENWALNEIVMPADTNSWGSAINKLSTAVPVYASTGDFYTVQSYNNNVISLTPLSYLDGTQNENPLSYLDGMNVVFKSNFNNQNNCSVNVNGLGIKQIKNINNTLLNAEIIKQGYYVSLKYDLLQGCFYLVNISENFQKISEKGQPNGYASLDATGKVPEEQLPEIIDLDKLNQSKALETGNVSNDSDVLADIRKYARSTFDLSKFTVVGTPTITDDGIVSGFSTSNYIINPSINIGGFNWKICSRVYTEINTVDDRTQCIFTDTNSANYADLNIGINRYGTGLTLVVKNETGTNNVVSVGHTDRKFSVNRWHDVVVEYVNQTLYGYVDGILQHKISVNLDNRNFSATQSMGCNSTGSQTQYGSIDLKYFSVTVDGVEVFSGNKTGVDTIKADDYTIVGSPTISDDGIASGFSTSDYLTNSFLFPSPQNKIEISTTFTITDSVRESIIFSYGGGDIFVTVKDTFIQWILRGTTGRLYFVKDLIINNGDKIKVDTIVKEGILEASIIINNTTPIQYTDSSPNLTFSTFQNTPLYIGVSNSSDYPTSGSIDLNSFKIYVDGNLVYQPCLKIPYTLSKTGSKIVQSIYRDRVQDMYEQEGYAPYYTLGESNFTLPMGEIYGMIEKKDSKSGHYLLELVPSIFPIDDAGVHLTDGSLISQDGVYAQGVKKIKELVAKYPQFSKTEEEWQALRTQYGEVPCVVIDDSAKTLRLPLIVNPIKGVSDFSQLARVIEAGLPNITGSIDTRGANLENPNGCLTCDTNDLANSDDVLDYAGNRILRIDAARSSSIYGKSSTVQPQQPTGCYYIVLATSIKTDIQVDIDKYVSDLNLKADKSEVARIKAYITETYVNSTSGYTVWSNGYCEQWGYVDATAATFVVNLLKTYSNSDYSILTTVNYTQAQTKRPVHIMAVTAGSFTAWTENTNGNFYWRSCGYLAQGQY